jgi:hypothetical protein
MSILGVTIGFVSLAVFCSVLFFILIIVLVLGYAKRQGPTNYSASVPQRVVDAPTEQPVTSSGPSSPTSPTPPADPTPPAPPAVPAPPQIPSVAPLSPPEAPEDTQRSDG